MPGRIIALDNPVREYHWGSTDYIPRLLGVPVTGRPVAELWVGAHPGSPSRAVGTGGVALDSLIAEAPQRLLGAGTVERFGPRLPFLLKVLAASRTLSLQVHPNAAQASAGFAAEQAADIALGAAERNYADPHHKPELAYALTEFEAFCGFRPVAETAELLDALAVAQLAPYRQVLVGEGGLRAAFTCLLTLPDGARAQLVAATMAGCERLATEGGRWTQEARAVRLAGSDFPGDIGAVLALLLNYVRLAPGEAIFLGAGNVHAYLRGSCLEVLASSDNVLRCGLTSKHVDVPELLRIADFSPLRQPRWRPERAGGLARFAGPAPDFVLTVLAGAGSAVPLPGVGPRLVLSGEGTLSLSDGAETVVLPPWHAAFVSAELMGCLVSGSDRAFVVSCDLTSPNRSEEI